MSFKEKNLKRLHLTVQAGSDRNSLNLPPQPAELNFIYGVDSKGLTGLESGLADIDIGGEKWFNIPGSALPEFLGHLQHVFVRTLGLHLIPANLHLKVTLAGAEQVEPAEIVQAMANSLKGGGCGGGCDCGC